MSIVPYDSNNPLITNFLSSLGQGESGGSSNSATLGVGGHDLSGYPTNQYGFPIWSGFGNSHAAGTYQFEPSTWNSIAQQYGLNFKNPQDQSAGAWYDAQQVYSRNTGGGDLASALASGDYQSIQNALGKEWPSVMGNGANPGGLASLLSGIGGMFGGLLGGGTASPGVGQSSSTTPFWTDIEDFFIRFGLIIVGTVVVVVALWQLLANTGAVPSPAKTAKGAVKGLAEVAA